MQKGKVVWFSAGKGFGFIAPDGSVDGVHRYERNCQPGK